MEMDRRDEDWSYRPRRADPRGPCVQKIGNGTVEHYFSDYADRPGSFRRVAVPSECMESETNENGATDRAEPKEYLVGKPRKERERNEVQGECRSYGEKNERGKKSRQRL